MAASEQKVKGHEFKVAFPYTVVVTKTILTVTTEIQLEQQLNLMNVIVIKCCYHDEVINF